MKKNKFLSLNEQKQKQIRNYILIEIIVYYSIKNYKK